MVTGANTSPQPDTANQQPVLRKSENRRSNKPIMEKRRRARINNCLNELKSLILDAMKKDPARHNKLEKADILEMTVKHLETMQRQQVALAAATDPKIVDKFRAGFRECAGEVGRFPGLEPPVRKRLLQHLASCLTPDENQVQVNLIGEQGVLLTSGQGEQGVLLPAGQLQVVPTRLPNGDIALVLPSRRQQPSPPPLTVLSPSPPSTPSLSPISSPPLSPPPTSHPISLVMPKTSMSKTSPVHEVWRPW